MSLLLSLIRQLFEFFGITTDRFIPVLDFKEYGRTRSVVRMIGTVLPFNPCPRPRFQETGQRAADCETLRNAIVPSLLDIAWLMNNGSESCAKFRNGISAKISGKPYRCFKPVERSTMSTSPEETVQVAGHLPQNETVWKIAALEEQLTQLRAQIAAIVAVQLQRDSFPARSLLGSPANVPFQGLTLTPLSASMHQPTIRPASPPPPPLPPPPPPASTDVSNSVINIIKQRRAANNNHPTTNDPTKKDSAESVPSMMDVLKDLNKIQLRAVERSPGGTPVTKKGKKRNSLSDPAELIAQALKKKFARHKNDDSIGKENQSFEGSPFSSPETPVFGRHLLKPSGKRPALSGANQTVNAACVKVPTHV